MILFSIGICFLVASFGITVLFNGGIYLGLPLYIVGMLFISFCKYGWRTKFIVLIFPLFVYFIYYYIDHIPTKTILIPSDFEGSFRIVYDEPCGSSPSLANGRPVFIIPKSGVLITRSKFIDDRRNEYFLVSQNGKKRKINQTSPYPYKPKKSPCVQIPYPSTLGESISFDNFTRDTTTQMIFSDYFLFNGITTDRENENIFLFLILTDSLVMECRGR